MRGIPAAGALAVFPGLGLAKDPEGVPFRMDADFWRRPRELALYRAATNENIRVLYSNGESLIADGYWKACAVLRDVRENVMTKMDPLLLDILAGVQGYYRAWGYPYPLIVNSGFRTERTNARLSKEGAARNSMHLYGKAVDIRVHGIPVTHVAQLGLYLRQGGVGVYESKNFVHLDTGRFRAWRS